VAAGGGAGGDDGQAGREALRLSEEHYRILVEHATEAIVVLDLDAGRFREVNENAVRLFGLSREELLARGPVDLSPPTQPGGETSLDLVRARVAEAAEGGSPEFEWVHRDAGGRDVPCEVRLVRLPVSGRVLIRGCITDIRARKRADALRDAGRRVLERIARGAPLEETLGTICSLVEGEAEGALCSVLLLDEAGERLRRGAAPSLPEEWNRLIHDVPIGPSAGSCGAAAFHGRPIVVTDLERDPLWKDWHHLATPHGLRACWSTPIASAGKVLGTFALYYRVPRGPTPEERALVDGAVHVASIAIERGRAEVALRESELRARSLYTATPAMMHSIDREGRIVSVSDRWLTALGYTHDEVIGRRSIEFLAPASREKALREVLPGFFRTGSCQDVHYQYVRKDGALLDVLLSATSERDQSGQVVRSLAVLVDVTARLRAEEARRIAEARVLASMRENELLLREQLRMEEQLRQAQRMEALGRLAGGVAHDFNNLLTVVLANSDLLLRLGGASPVQQEGLVEIKQAVERGAALTRQLLAFSRKQVLEPRVLDLNAVVRGVETLLRRLIGEDLALTIRLATDLGLVRADAGQLEQVLLNLVVNARDAMASGGELCVETRNEELAAGAARDHGLAASGAFVVIVVRDTGCGMDAATLARVFEPFFTTKGPTRGTGLGLSTVYGIVRQSGGSVTVESEVGRGSTFTVLLPRVWDAIAEGTAPGPVRRAPGGRETILLVEDDDAVRAGVQKLLVASGHSLLAARTGEEALALAAAHPGRIDLLVTDTVLPGLTGPELAARLRATRPDTKVLHVSGYPEQAAAQLGAGADPVAFLAKPFSAEALLGKLRQLLDA